MCGMVPMFLFEGNALATWESPGVKCLFSVLAWSRFSFISCFLIFTLR